jgi:murein tripeptide amidase MpaA
MKREYRSLIVLLICGLFFCISGAQALTSNPSVPQTTEMEPYEYYTYDEMTILLQQLAQNHSEFMHLESLGTTFQGRDIWLVKLSDNVADDEAEPEVLLMGAHHGDEKPSFEVLIYFIKYVAEKANMPNTDDDGDGLINEDMFDGIDNDGDGAVDEDPSEDRVRTILNETEIYIIPMVNPDGVEFEWRKNRAPNYGPDGTASYITSYGVDLNRNYGFVGCYQISFLISIIWSI